MEAHINFDSGLFNDDIGIITVDEPFDFSDPHVQPIDWFKADDSEIQSETVCNSTGWGITFRSGSCTSELQMKVNCKIKYGLVFQLLAKPAK